MKTLIAIGIASLVSVMGLCAEGVSLVRAAEITRDFLQTKKVDGKPLGEIVRVRALRSVQSNSRATGKVVVWRVDLTELRGIDADAGWSVAFEDQGTKYRHVLEITDDGKATIGRVRAAGRPRILVVPPGTARGSSDK